MANYWSNRVQRELDQIERTSEAKINAKVAKEYKRLIKEVREDFLSLQAEILEAEEAPTANSMYRYDSYYKLMKKMDDELAKIDERMSAEFAAELEAAYKNTFTSSSLSLGDFDSEVVLDMEALPSIIKSVWVDDGLSFSQRIWKNNENLKATLVDGLAQCIAKGSSPRVLKEMLQERFSVSYNEANRMARTELCHVQTVATQNRYQQMGVEQIEVLTEPNACDECKEKFIGKKYAVNMASRLVPKHPNCKCCVVPVV